MTRRLPGFAALVAGVKALWLLRGKGVCLKRRTAPWPLTGMAGDCTFAV